MYPSPASNSGRYPEPPNAQRLWTGDYSKTCSLHSMPPEMEFSAKKKSVCKPHQTELSNLHSSSPAICKHRNLLIVCLLAISMHFPQKGRHQMTRDGHNCENTAHRTRSNRVSDMQDLINYIWLHSDTWEDSSGVFAQCSTRREPRAKKASRQ